VCNGHRCRATAINPGNNRLAARRLDDNTVAVFFNDYVRADITYGCTVTVHSTQGVTADTTHAVLGEPTYPIAILRRPDRRPRQPAVALTTLTG
jgi:hypothetical protein